MADAGNTPEGVIPKQAPEDVVNDELVEVFDCQEESEALVVKGLLEANGIAALITSLDTQQDLFPNVGGVVVRVRGDQAEEARRLIEESRESAEAEESTLADDGALDGEDTEADYRSASSQAAMRNPRSKGSSDLPPSE
jgi:hypothetical protein